MLNDLEFSKCANIERFTQLWGDILHKVKPLITNTSEEFIKCRLEHF